MKYLRTYEAYSADIKSEILDILRDLEDDGYEVHVHKSGTTGTDCYLPINRGDSIDIWMAKGTTQERCNGMSFTWADIKPVMQQLISYLSGSYIVSNVKALFNGYEQKIIDLDSTQEFATATITFSPKSNESVNELENKVNSLKSIQDTITDIFSNLTDEYPIKIEYSVLEVSPLLLSINLLPDYSKMGGASLKLAAIEIEKLKEFTKNYIPNSSIAPKKNPSLKDRYNFLIRVNN